MAKKKSVHRPFMTIELQDILAGGILLTLAALMFLATSEASIAGKYLSIIGMSLFGEYYRWIFSPILTALGAMILVKKVSWSSARLTGIILFFVSVTSLFGLYQDRSLAIKAYNAIGFFDLHIQSITFFGKGATILALLVLFFVSLYMTLRISYRTLLSKMRSSMPSLGTMRNAMISDEEDDRAPIKKMKVDETYKKKAEELERKIANLQKGKGTQKEEKPVLSGKSIIGNALSSLTKKVPLETPDGKVIEPKGKQQSLDFGTWDFPSVKLLNHIEHKNLVSPDEVEEKSLLIQKTFLQFGIDVEMEEECVGPTVIQYRLRPSE